MLALHGDRLKPGTLWGAGHAITAGLCVPENGRNLIRTGECVGKVIRPNNCSLAADIKKTG